MAEFLKDPAFMAAHEAPLKFKFQNSEGKSVTFKSADGQDVDGYYVAPKSGANTAIVMVHEWWGLNDYVKREAVALHDKMGYAVLAVDLYGGKVAATADDAGKYMAAVDSAQATSVVKGAVENLTNGSLGFSAKKIGTIGWCFGGGWSLRAAIQGGDAVKACVMYYGMPDNDPGDLAKLQAPVLLVEALQDKWISPAVVQGFRVAMKAAGKMLTVRTYNADHAFANPSNPKYDKPDADDALSATYRFYERYLGK